MPTWSYYGPKEWRFVEMTECKWYGDNPTRFGSNEYTSDLSGWNRFAVALMKFMTNPMNESDHWGLYENLYSGDTMGSMLSLSRKNALYFNVYYVLLSLCLLPALLFVLAIWRRNKKLSSKSGSLACLWFSQIPLTILTIALGVFFTIILWESLGISHSNNNAYNAIKDIKTVRDEQLWMGQCELDNLEDKMASFKRQFCWGLAAGGDYYSEPRGIFNTTENVDCSIVETLKQRQDLLLSDQDSLEEVSHQTALLKNHLEKLISLEGLDSLEKDAANLTLSEIREYDSLLLAVSETLTDAQKKVEKHLTQVLEVRKTFNKKSEEAINGLKASLDKIYASVKKVKESLDNAVEKLAQFATTVAQRFHRIESDIRQKNPLFFAILIQVVVSTGVITTLICFSLGILAMGYRLVDPKPIKFDTTQLRALELPFVLSKPLHKQLMFLFGVLVAVGVLIFFALNSFLLMICCGLGTLVFGSLLIMKASGVTKVVRKLLLFGFFLLGVCSILCFITSALTLSYAVPMTRTCDTLTNVEDYDYNGPAVLFHRTIGENFTLVNALGEKISMSFARFITIDGYDSLASTEGNGHQDLLNPMHARARGWKLWEGYGNQTTPSLTMDEMEIISHSEEREFNRLVQDLKEFMYALGRVNLPKGSSQMRELAAEIRILSSMLSQVKLQSLKELKLDECRHEFKDLTNKASRMQLMDKIIEGINNYQKVVMSEHHYQTSKFNYLYRGEATSDFCVQFRFPLSGIWLAITLLAFLLSCNMIIVLNVADYLKKEKNSEATESKNLSTVDLRAPLLEEGAEEK